MIYRSDLKVLHFLKRVQLDEAHYISIKSDFCSAVHCRDFGARAVNSAWEDSPRYRLKMPISSFSACVKSLCENGYLSKIHAGDVYQVTHDGWNAYEVIRRERLEFLMTHALFPSFVSLAVSAMTYVIKAVFFR